MRANGFITVHKYEPAGVAEFLQVASADGAASFVGLERVTGGFRANLGADAQIHLDYSFE
jgi:hypothetical protein